MNTQKTILIVIASALSFGLAIEITARMHYEKNHFDGTVRDALKTSEGYDQLFIDMVNRLEDELANRASFGYAGGKDPMTGTKRRVVLQPVVVARPQPMKTALPSAPIDPFKLTAIIADEAGRKITAIVMNGERSYSVDQGDVVAGRKITKITNEGIYMENDTSLYYYDIFGKRENKRKEGAASPLPSGGQP